MWSLYRALSISDLITDYGWAANHHRNRESRLNLIALNGELQSITTKEIKREELELLILVMKDGLEDGKGRL